MDESGSTFPPKISESNPNNEKSDLVDETQIVIPIENSKLLVKKPSNKSKLSLKSKSSTKSKPSLKLQSVEKTQSNKVLLAKSLDSVKALLASKDSSERNLKEAESVGKISRATSMGTFFKRKLKAKKSKRQKVPKKLKLDGDIVKKIARELIRKRGSSLLNVDPIRIKRRRRKKKPKDKINM